MINFILEKLVMPIAGVGVVLGIIGLIIALIYSIKYNNELTNMCLKDGHKEYECYSMLKSNNSTYVPIIIH